MSQQGSVMVRWVDGSHLLHLVSLIAGTDDEQVKALVNTIQLATLGKT
jgi:hypothetical protein